jgi:hypothetical protein
LLANAVPGFISEANQYQFTCWGKTTFPRNRVDQEAVGAVPAPFKEIFFISFDTA